MGWVHPLVGLGGVFLISGGLGWMESWLRDILTSWNTLLSANEYCSWIITVIDSWLVECRVNNLNIGKVFDYLLNPLARNNHRTQLQDSFAALRDGGEVNSSSAAPATAANVEDELCRYKERYAVTVINCSVAILVETFRWLSSVISCCPARVLYFEPLGSVRDRLLLCVTYCNRCEVTAVCKHSGVSWTTEVRAECGTPLTFILAANCELVCNA